MKCDFCGVYYQESSLAGHVCHQNPQIIANQWKDSSADLSCRLAAIEGFLKGFTDGLNARLESIESLLRHKVNKGSKPVGDK